MEIRDVTVIKSCFISHLEVGQVFAFKKNIFLKCYFDLFVNMESNRVYRLEGEALQLVGGGYLITGFKQKREVCVLNAALNIFPYSHDPDDTETSVVQIIPAVSHLILDQEQDGQGDGSPPA